MWLFPLLACGPDEVAESPTPEDTGSSARDSVPVDTDTHESAPDDSAHESTPPDDTDDSGDTGDPPQPDQGPVILLFIGDGMGFEHVRGGGLYRNGSEGSLAMESLEYQGRLRTASLSGTTDSAAGATALGTGEKAHNGYLGMDRDGVSVPSILSLAGDLGFSTGIVTTDELTGATPSAFFAHVESRGDTEEIAAQLVAGLPTITLGGGYSDLEAALVSADAQIVTTADDLDAAVDDGRPLLGVFSDSMFPYVADGYLDEPAIVDMTTTAIGWLEDDPEGFVLVVEGARIDHASHADDGSRVHHETAAFDEAVEAAIAWADTSGRDVTLVVTADHECGGLEVSGGGSPGVIPDSAWRWMQHTNADVPVFARGAAASVLDGQRLDNTWVHAVLSAAIEERAVVAPEEGLLADGWTEDLGAVVTTQTWATSFGAGYNQLDALRVTSDADGLWIGVDGVFEFGSNSLAILLDLDFGEGTGFGADVTLSDTTGELDAALTALPYTAAVDGLGFDVAVGSVGAQEIGEPDLFDYAGLRGMTGAWGASDNFAWLNMVTSFDDGNLASDSDAAPDAGATGATAGGWEAQVFWRSVFPTGIPAEGREIALAVVLADDDGDWASNQALPPLASADEPGAGGAEIVSVVTLTVDASGSIVAGPAVEP